MTTRPPLAVAPASIGRRAGAYAIDLGVAYGIGVACAGITLGIALGLGAATDPGGLAFAFALASAAMWVALLGWVFVYTAMQGAQGSVGQRALDLRLLSDDAPTPVGFWRALWRNVVWALSCAIVVGWFSPLFDSTPRRQGWHDKAGRTIVLDTRGADASARAAAQATRFAPAPQAVTVVAASPSPVAYGAGHAVDPHPWFLADSPATPARQRSVPAAVPAHAAVPSPAQRPAPAPVASAGLPAAQAGPPTVSIPQIVAPAPAYAMAGASAHPAPAAYAPPAPEPAAYAAPARGYAAPLAAPVREASAPATVMIPQVPAHAHPVAEASADIDATRTAITVPPPAQRAALFADAPVLAVLTWDDGSRMAVYGRTLYGRNPIVEGGTVSVPVRDETLSLSKTHFEIGGDASGAWIADRHSTNGTVLVRDGGRHPLIAGMPTSLRPGDRLELGDRSAIVGSA